MRLDLKTLPASGLTVRDIGMVSENCASAWPNMCSLREHPGQHRSEGFPDRLRGCQPDIVRVYRSVRVAICTRSVLVHLIHRYYVLNLLTDKAKDYQDVQAGTPVSFAPDAEDEEEAEFSGMASGPAVGIDDELSLEIMETTATPDVLKLWPWVNQVRNKCLYARIQNYERLAGRHRSPYLRNYRSR